MNILPIILKLVPGLSPQWRDAISTAFTTASSYGNDRAALLRAINDRNLTIQDIQRGMSYLQNGPVANILNAFQPGATQRMQGIFNGVIQDMQKNKNESGISTSLNRPGNPFPDLK